MKKYATIKDIAKSLNVSTATVSRSLSNKPDVKLATKQKVLDEASRLNYRPNPVALRLKNKRTKTIGIVVPELKTGFFPLIITGMQNILEERGYQIIITQSNESKEKEARNLSFLVNNMVEGILLSVTRDGSNDTLYQKIIDSGTPIVFFNRASESIIAPKVGIKDYELAFFATEHLIYNKFNKIYHLAGPENLDVTKKRIKGFTDALKKHHLLIEENTITRAGVLMEKGYDAMLSLIKKEDIPEAIFCFNDPTAFGALRAIKEAGLRCPEDVALIGFSETDTALLIDPPLSSIAQPHNEIGESATNLLLEQIELEHPPEPKTIYIRATLNYRASSENRRYQAK